MSKKCDHCGELLEDCICDMKMDDVDDELEDLV